MKSTWNKLIHWLQVGERRAWLVFAGLAIIILLPLFLPGYILTLDMVFTPHMPWPSELTSTYPLDIVLCLLSYILPGDVLQKILLFVILWLSGMGMYLVVRDVTLDSTQKRWLEVDASSWQLAAYVAGLLYVINPFMYARLMAGQWWVLLGYALLPFLVRALFRLLQTPNWKTTALAAVWMVVVTVASVHFAGMVAVLTVLFFAAGTIKHWHQKTRLWLFVRSLIVALFTTIVISSYWLIPAILGHGAIGEIAERADEAEFMGFATHSGPLGTVGEVLRLQGFWVETRELFLLPQAVMPLWGIAILFLWVLVVIGAIQLWRANRPLAVVMISCIVVGCIVAASPLIQWLAQVFPLLGGYREPHKFTVLVAVGYAVLAAIGSAYLVKKYKTKKTLAVFCLALPLVIAPTMLWGGAGQLRPVDYPQEWYTLNQKLKDNGESGKFILFLPWHMYAPYSFSNNRIIASPAEKFFEVPVLMSDDPEYADMMPGRQNNVKQHVAELLRYPPENLAENLRSLNISHVILAKEQDWQDYSFLQQLPIVHEDGKLILYEVPQ